MKKISWTLILCIIVFGLTALNFVNHRAYVLQSELLDASRVSTISALKQKEQTLDLALEFGFDPMIVQVTQQLATNAFKVKHAPITWRFVKTDKELAYLLLSIIQTESRGDSTAYNRSGASGLTQLLFSTAKQYDKNLKPADLLTLPKNLEIAMTHFVNLLEQYRGNPYLATLAWNRGSTGADRIAVSGVNTDAYVNAVFMQAAVRNAQ